ncbi:hypothetical protein SCALM49S_07367 [Streptomyces californicus]
MEPWRTPRTRPVPEKRPRRKGRKGRESRAGWKGRAGWKVRKRRGGPVCQTSGTRQSSRRCSPSPASAYVVLDPQLRLVRANAHFEGVATKEYIGRRSPTPSGWTTRRAPRNC